MSSAQDHGALELHLGKFPPRMAVVNRIAKVKECLSAGKVVLRKPHPGGWVRPVALRGSRTLPWSLGGEAGCLLHLHCSDSICPEF